MTVFDILRDSDYRSKQFSSEAIERLNARIEQRVDKHGRKYAVAKCLVRDKQIILRPEEVIRQLLIDKLINEYGYPTSRMQLEYPVYFGREVKRADLVIMDEDRPHDPYIVIEVKKPRHWDGKDQLKSYCNSTGAPMAVWTNGDQIRFYNRRDPNYFEDIANIPTAQQTLEDILSARWTIQDLRENDRLKKERISLKEVILGLEDEVLANAGVDVFEECFKLIFAKLYDEFLSGQTPDRYLEFTSAGRTDFKLKEKIQELFDKANQKWKGVFDENTKILLSPSHLAICVSSLQNVKLFNSNLDVVDDAFEYLMSKSSKGEKGQFFTPRYVIEMCVRMLDPQEGEKMIDTACGSSGFPVHTIFHVWRQMAKDRNLDIDEFFSLEQKPYEFTEYVRENVFGIDFDEKAVRVARTLNLIAGDGHTNVLHLNTLDYTQWSETAKQEDWLSSYFEGYDRLKKMRTNRDSFRDFNFDIVMANPPFAGDIKESRIVSMFDLGKNAQGKQLSKVGRDVLFIERNIDFLKPGGRMAIVLPQGRFNNSTDKYIREYIAERCRILAVVGLHGNVFKPHTGTKTSVLFVQKWGGSYTDEQTGEERALCPRKEDYPIFFATMQKPSKDNSGDAIYVRDPETGERKLDSHGHMYVDHDLYNHEGLTQDGIAEAFAEFAKKEGLRFFR